MDALIVQDLGVVKIAKEIGLTVPLHASVMMNAHNLEGLQTARGSRHQQGDPGEGADPR